MEVVTQAVNIRRGIGTKLTEELVQAIYLHHNFGITHRAIAAMVGVHPCQISRILAGRRWSEFKPMMEVV
jgi:hypothetical protein